MVNDVTFRAGERLSARKLNLLASLLEENMAPARASAQANYSPEMIRTLEIKQIDNAQRRLLCTYPGATGNPAAVTWNVYLPQVFTESSRDGVTFTYQDLNTREADDGNVIEQHEITPKFVVNEIVYAIVFSGELEYRWLPDGRMWARVQQ